MSKQEKTIFLQKTRYSPFKNSQPSKSSVGIIRALEGGYGFVENFLLGVKALITILWIPVFLHCITPPSCETPGNKILIFFLCPFNPSYASLIGSIKVTHSNVIAFWMTYNSQFLSNSASLAFTRDKWFSNFANACCFFLITETNKKRTNRIRSN